MPRVVSSGQPDRPRVEDHRTPLLIPGLYSELIARFAVPAAPDARILQAIEATHDDAERAELTVHAEADRRETNRRNHAELEWRRRSDEPFRLARWQVITRDVREAGLPVGDRAYSEYEVDRHDVTRPIAKGYGVDRQEWTGDGWAHVPSIAPISVA